MFHLCHVPNFILCVLSRHAPSLVPFEERARVFQTVIMSDRLEQREMGIYGPQSFTMIRRASVFQVCGPVHLRSDLVASADFFLW